MTVIIDLEKTKATRRGVELHKNNPFMMTVETKTKRITNRRGDMMIVQSQTGEIKTNIAGFWESKEVDSSKFVKLFVRGVKALKELTQAGTKVFEVLCIKVQATIGSDRVYINWSEIDQAVSPMSESTYSRGMRELLEKKFIAATQTQGWFWINPDFVWNGDRLAFVQEYRKIGSKKPLQIDDKTVDMFNEASDALPPPGALEE